MKPFTTAVIPADAGTLAASEFGTEPILAWAISYDTDIQDYRVTPIGVNGEVEGVVAYKINGRNVVAA